MYTLIVRSNARKNLDKLDPTAQARILIALDQLESDPFQGKKLKGELKGFWSLRVWPYRIVYEIRKHELVVFVIEISDRKDAYK